MKKISKQWSIYLLFLSIAIGEGRTYDLSRPLNANARNRIDDWTAISGERGVLIDYSLTDNPLQIRTDSLVGSRDLVWVRFFTDNGTEIGGVRIHFTHPPQYYIGYCTNANSGVTWPDMPREQVKVWTITKTEASIGIVCNGVEMVNYQFSRSSRKGCLSHWRENAGKMMFRDDDQGTDTASDAYRAILKPRGWKIQKSQSVLSSPHRKPQAHISRQEVSTSSGLGIKEVPDLEADLALPEVPDLEVEVEVEVEVPALEVEVEVPALEVEVDVHVSRYEVFQDDRTWGLIEGFNFDDAALWGARHGGVEDAMAACLSDENCWGVSELDRGMWRMGSGAELNKANERVTWVLINWCQHSNSFLPSYSGNTSYSDLARAQGACLAQRSECGGITQEPYNNNRYTLRVGPQLQASLQQETAWVICQERQEQQNRREKLLGVENLIEDTLIEDTLIEDTLIEDTVIGDNLIEDNLIKENLPGLKNLLEDTQVQASTECPGGWYVDAGVCTECEAGSYSTGNSSTICHPCKGGKTTVSGTASTESDCKWGWTNKTEAINFDFSEVGLQIKTKPSISNFNRVVISFGSVKDNGYYTGGFSWNSSHITSIYLQSPDHYCDKPDIPFNSLNTDMADSIWTVYFMDGTLLVDWNDTRILEYTIEEAVFGECWDVLDQWSSGLKQLHFEEADSATLYYRITEEYPQVYITESGTTPPTAATTEVYSNPSVYLYNPQDDVARFQVCWKAYFDDCTVRSVALDSTVTFENPIQSIRLLNQLPDNGSVILTSDFQNKTYRISGYFADANLEDGVSMRGFYLEAEGGTTITAIRYVQQASRDSQSTLVPTLTPPVRYSTTQQTTTVTPKIWKMQTDEPVPDVEPTPYNVTEAVEQVKELLLTNTVNFEEEIVETDPETNVSLSIRVWKPDFNGSSIPITEAINKADEYTSNRDVTNVLGFLTYNGYTDYAITKHNVEHSVAREDQETSVSESVMVDTIKAYQRFNGFPETGDLTEEQVKPFNTSRCGNADVNYVGEKETFTCKEGRALDNDQGDSVNPTEAHLACPDPHDKLNLCSIYPTDLELEDYKDFVWKNSYYFETDVEYGSRDTSRISHVGIAFNYNRLQKTADYLYVKCDRLLERLCFSYGTFNNGERTHVGSVDCLPFQNEEQKITQQFKFRLSVKEENATFYVNGDRALKFSPSAPVKSSVFVFTLDGRYHDHQKIKVMTSRICRRNTEHGTYRKKRYALTSFKWFPGEGEAITYSFVNYASSLGEAGTRSEIHRALVVFAKDGKFNFKEVFPRFADSAQITFMFIKGPHADGTSFDTAGAEKAHAFSPVHGEIHFNDHEDWSIADTGSRRTSLFFVALHELGHAFGLKHSAIKNAVMHAAYEHDKAYATAGLDEDDVDALESQYGDLSGVYAGEVDNVENLVAGQTNEDYEHRLPTPKCCHSYVEAALYYYKRSDGVEDKDRIFVMTDGYLWRYKANAFYAGADDGYPKRVAEVFRGAAGNIDAAFDTGKYIFLIQGKKVLRYSVNSKVLYTIDFEQESTLQEEFGIPDTVRVQSAFNHEKKKDCDKRSDRCVKTTLIISRSERYELEWVSYGKKLKSKELKTTGADVLGEEFPEGQFGAAFEYNRATVSGKSFEVMQFDAYTTCRSRLPYPDKTVTQNDGTNNVPDLFHIAGWCTTDAGAGC